ncbi:MAG: metallophosphoesterase [Candidatus Aenigmatarchaeota archaeon]
MRIAVLSDLHLGFSHSPETEEDAFDNAEEAIEKAIDSDLILILGDIFDSKLPKTQVLGKAIKILVKPLQKESTGVRLLGSTKELKKILRRTLEHLPVIALHGTHERKEGGEMNIIEVLENAGLLIHLHCNSLVFEKNGIKVAIHGMSGVPERFAGDMIKKWNPTPIKDCFNLLLLHQNIEPYVYSLEPPTISVSTLPSGFDMIIDGHVHERQLIDLGHTKLLFPGSTIVTQIKKEEMNEKGFYMLEFGKEIKVKFIPLEKNRKIFYEEVFLNGSVREEIEKTVEKILEKEFDKKPLIKIKVFGKESNTIDKELRNLEKKYSERAILIFSKEVESPAITKKIELLRNIKEQKHSIEEIGLEIFKKNLEELNYSFFIDYEYLFEVLAEGDVDKIIKILTGEQKTLENFKK